jgi:uncharacterized coiled-coil protein SlyX
VTDSPDQARLDSLEILYAHQESAVDELTRNQLDQARLIERLQTQVERLELALRTLEAKTPLSAPSDERPPHY